MSNNCPFCDAKISSINFDGYKAYCTSCRTEFSFYPRSWLQYFDGTNAARNLWECRPIKGPPGESKLVNFHFLSQQRQEELIHEWSEQELKEARDGFTLDESAIAEFRGESESEPVSNKPVGGR